MAKITRKEFGNYLFSKHCQKNNEYKTEETAHIQKILC